MAAEFEEKKDSPQANEKPPEGNTVIRALFELGRVCITPAAAEIVSLELARISLRRHICGDWGELSPADQAENELSLREGFRLMSVYHTEGGEKFWIITEADRSVTTILLPSDY